MASYPRKLLIIDHDPSLVPSTSSQPSPPPSKIEERENTTTSYSYSNYSGTCCYSDLKLSPPFDSAMALTVLVLLIALFFMGFFSIYIRRFADESTVDPRRGRRGSGLSSRAAPYSGRSKKGADLKTVESLPVHEYKSAGAKQGITETECAICLSEFEEREWVKEIPYCGHVFHVECIDKWLLSHVTCPLCRTAKLVAAGDDEEEKEVKEERGLSGVNEVQGSDGGDEVRIAMAMDEGDTWRRERGVGVGSDSVDARSSCSGGEERERRLHRSMSF